MDYSPWGCKELGMTASKDVLKHLHTVNQLKYKDICGRAKSSRISE